MYADTRNVTGSSCFFPHFKVAARPAHSFLKSVDQKSAKAAYNVYLASVSFILPLIRLVTDYL